MEHQSPKFLVLDDDPFFGEFMLDVADAIGVTVCVARNAESARACIATLGINVAIVDFDLDGTTGVDFASEFPEVPVVLVSRSNRFLDRAVHSSPKNVVKTIPKSRGPMELFGAALDVFCSAREAHYRRHWSDI